MSNDANAVNKNLLIGPNIATGDWVPEDVWQTGFVDTYSENLAYLAVEQYVSRHLETYYSYICIATQRTTVTLFTDLGRLATPKPCSPRT